MPVLDSETVAAAGLFVGIWYFKITATSGDGETTASNEVSFALAALNGVILNWNPVANAVGYNAYLGFAPGGEAIMVPLGPGSSDGAGHLFAPVFAPFGLAITPPASNTTAGPLWDVAGNVGLPDEGYWLAQGNGRVGGRYITRLDEPGGYAQTIPRGFMRYASGGQTTEGLMKVVPEIVRKFTWHQVPRNGVPVQAIISSLGTVNNAPFDGWPVGTLLLDGVDPRRYRDPLLNRCLDLTYSMVGKPNFNRFGQAMGHNSALKYFPPSADGTVPGYVDYDLICSDDNGKGDPPYRSTNFADLFRAPQT